MNLPRRDWLLGLATVTAACRRDRRPASLGYRGFAFVANSAGQAVAAVDLAALAVTRHIALGANPTQMIDDPRRQAVFAVTPASGEVVEISTNRLAVARRAAVGAPPAFAKLSTDGRYLWVLSREARQLVRIPVEAFRPDLRIPLPGDPVDFDLGPGEERSRDLVAVSLNGPAPQALIFNGATGKAAGGIHLAGEAPAGPVLFRKDGRQLLAANRATHRLVIADLASYRVVTSLALAVCPDRLCAKDDGGQVFITGEKTDAIVTVYPFQTEVANTMLVGHSPGAMAVSPIWNYLLVARPASGDVAVVSIANRQMLAVAPVGKAPEFITVTPDGNYALVLNRDSGDLALLHLVIERRRTRSAAVAARIPVGSSPVGAVVRAG